MRHTPRTARAANHLYCGDNLDVLRKEIRDASVDLVYLDPPFKSDRTYNVLYTEQDGRKAAAQQRAFEDTWEWNQAAKDSHERMIEQGGRIADALRAFYSFLGPTPLMAYLSMMAPRLFELHRVLKPTGTLYLHCDPSASHYLKVILDAVFGPLNCRNEIIWKRTSAHGDASRRFASVHDTILVYGKSKDSKWNKSFLPYSDEYTKEHFVHRDPDGRLFRRVDLRSPNPRPNLTYDYRASNGRLYKPHRNGWAVSLELMRKLDKQRRLFFPAKVNGRLRRKIYLDESSGVPVSDVWTDLPPIHASSQERLGYPTQKPEALLERILKASSNKGDVILDPFCGCGTAVAVSERLERTWIGIDITHLAIGVIRGRLHNNGIDADEYQTHWVPATVDEAVELAVSDPFQFQCWVLGELGINPLHQKRGADRGIDGRLFFFDGPDTSRPKQLIFSVKSGGITPAYVRELGGVVKRERAQIGVLVTLEDPSSAMKKEAATADHYRAHDDSMYPGIQILTVAEILQGKRPQMPASRTLSFPDPKMLKIALTEQQQQLKFG